MPRYCRLFWCWLQVEARALQSASVQSHVSWEQRHRPAVQCTDGCSAWDRTTWLPGIACTWPKQQQQTNKQLSGSQKLWTFFHACSVERVLRRHHSWSQTGSTHVVFVAVVFSQWLSVVFFGSFLQIKKIVAEGQSCWSISFFFMALHSNTRDWVWSVVAWWRLQPQNERCQLIKEHMSPGEITGEHFQSELCNNMYKSVVLSLIWLHSLVCQILNKQMSQLVAYSSNICVWVVSCNECVGWQFGRRSPS